MDYRFKIKTDKYFSLERTFNCGQCFRFDELEDGTFTGVALGRCINLRQDNEYTYISCDEKEYNDVWLKYFDLDRNYKNIAENLSKLDETMKLAVEYSPGIRILRQDPFEALISFIISQNNNIKRIKGIVKKLCENFGDKLDENTYNFPKADVLANLSLEDLQVLRCGFRDKYILDAAQQVAQGKINLELLRNMPIDAAREKLTTIKGVGPKVADCELIYGLHRLEAFPMDVWMKRTMKAFYPDKTPEYFGEYAGIAGQYLFHYSRVGKAIDNISIKNGKL